MLYLAGTVITFAFSVVFSMAGLGAAFLYVPLFYWLGVPLAQAMSVALLLNFVSLSAATVVYARKGLVAYRTALPVLVVAVILSPVGAWASRYVPRTQLLWLFVAFLFFAAYMMLLNRQQPRAPQERLTAFPVTLGGVAGFLGGLLGVGGGNIILPGLVSSGVEPKRAAATTAFIVVFSSLSGFLGRISFGRLDWAFLFATAVAGSAGALTGALMRTQVSGSQLKRLIGSLLLLMAAKISGICSAGG